MINKFVSSRKYYIIEGENTSEVDDMQYRCADCQKLYMIQDTRFRCTCGGLFTLQYSKKPIDFSRSQVGADRSLWRYRDALPRLSPDTYQMVSLGEGGTPLVAIGPKVWGKADYMMPTLSFKDRGAVVLVSLMKELGVRRAIADSSGNAGTAIAAYCARAGIECEVFVPESTSSKKVEQILAHGADVHRIPGTREDTARAALAQVAQTGDFYASHIYNPLFWEGTKTYVYEVFEQFGGRLPEVLIIPVGNGTLLMGVSLALEELLEWGYIEKVPKLIAVQAANCAPLAKAFALGHQDYLRYPTSPTLAEGIGSAEPARGKEILQAMRKHGGDFVIVTEEEILEARQLLAHQGLYVELTSAANFAGYRVYAENHPELLAWETVVPLCGAGLKSAH
jgi:threonine synthase